MNDAPRQRTARVDVLLKGALTETAGKVVGTCDGGTKKIVYKRGG